MKGQEKDEEIMKGFQEIHDKFFPDVWDQANIEKQLARYRIMEGLFADPAAFLVAKEMPAHTWWSSYGSETPELQSFAIKVLSQVIVALACERNWSTFEFIHNRKRNRLTFQRALDLVFVFSSLHLKEKLNYLIQNIRENL